MGWIRHSFGKLLVVGVVATLPCSVFAVEQEAPSVGVAARLEQLVLPGSELEAKPLERKSPIVVRVLRVYPHGTEFRYDLEYYGLEAGEYDLKDYLQRKDGSDAGALPSIPVAIRSLLPKGQIEPHALVQSRSPWIGGYQLVLIALGVGWLIGLFAILLIGRQKTAAAAGAAHGPVTLSDRLRPMVESAIAGRLSIEKQAELERLLLAFWRQRLGLEKIKPAQALVVLRGHEEAGLLLRQLEKWLHAPRNSTNTDIEATIKTLLEPYTHVGRVGDQPSAAGEGR